MGKIIAVIFCQTKKLHRQKNCTVKLFSKLVGVKNSVLRGGIYGKRSWRGESRAGIKKQSETHKRLYGKIPVKSKGAKLKGAELPANDCPAPHSYMSMETKNAGENISEQIYGEVYNWLKKRKCEHLIQPQLIEQYALSYARYAQAETAIHQFGMLAKNQNSGNAVPSPFIEISQTYLKQSQNIWLSIYSTVKDSCIEYTEESAL